MVSYWHHDVVRLSVHPYVSQLTLCIMVIRFGAEG